MREPIIAIDGPSGVGKSTLSKLLARELGFLHLDTGAMYRAVALAAQRRGIAATDHAALGSLAGEVTIDFVRDAGSERVLLDGEDVSAAIRTPEISLLTSQVSACPAVRAAMVERQRVLGSPGGVVLEGRDIGTVVFPDAQVKIFLTASAAERGRRRFLELQTKGMSVDLARTIAEVEARDTADSGRSHSPLCQATDAVVIDTSSLTVDQVLAEMLSLVAQRRPAPPGSDHRLPAELILARSAGFCFGVKRATQMAFAAADCHQQICSLGPIIHSPQLVEKLADHGVTVVDQVEDIPAGAVIIRSHGVTAGEMQGILARDLTVVDATCPFVKKAQEYAARLAAEGYTVIIVGEAEHPEVQGIVSYATAGPVQVVANAAQAVQLPRLGRVGIIAQTTQSFENLRQVADICLEKSQELRVFNTICDATTVRQNEAREIARQVDVMLVIGGFNSANTTRLAQICREIQPATHHLETVGEIQRAWFDGASRIGITAGASTPRWLIDEVVSQVAELTNPAGK
jgi:4-hydroxy-3-methylbut-2-enyl diphosphate reductase